MTGPMFDPADLCPKKGDHRSDLDDIPCLRRRLSLRGRCRTKVVGNAWRARSCSASRLRRSFRGLGAGARAPREASGTLVAIPEHPERRSPTIGERARFVALPVYAAPEMAGPVRRVVPAEV